MPNLREAIALSWTPNFWCAVNEIAVTMWLPSTWAARPPRVSRQGRAPTTNPDAIPRTDDDLDLVLVRDLDHADEAQRGHLLDEHLDVDLRVVNVPGAVQDDNGAPATTTIVGQRAHTHERMRSPNRLLMTRSPLIRLRFMTASWMLANGSGISIDTFDPTMSFSGTPNICGANEFTARIVPIDASSPEMTTTELCATGSDDGGRSAPTPRSGRACDRRRAACGTSPSPS